MEAEQRAHMERTIARFEACGDKHQAAIYRAEISKLRSTLEKQYPPFGTPPKGPSFVVGITNPDPATILEDPASSHRHLPEDARAPWGLRATRAPRGSRSR